MAGFPSFSTTYQQKLLDHLFGKATLTAPANIYVALYTTAPTDAAGGTEAAYTGYARVSTSPANWAAATAATPSVTANSAVVTFGLCTAGSSTVVAFGLFDAVAGVYIGGGNVSISISAGITPSFAISALTATLD